VQTGAVKGAAVEIKGMVEKPRPEDAPSRLCVIGRYILQPEIFAVLDRQERGAGNAHPEASLLLNAYRARVPVTVHVAIGTDTPHTHPAADGAAIGSATHRDFRLFCTLVTELHQGGIYLNVGSAVLLPEVFLKAVSAVRNLGHPLAEFTTANFDFLQHYRPRVNVVERPHASSGGKGYAITGHHELMIPLLAAALIERHP